MVCSEQERTQGWARPGDTLPGRWPPCAPRLLLEIKPEARSRDGALGRGGTGWTWVWKGGSGRRAGGQRKPWGGGADRSGRFCPDCGEGRWSEEVRLGTGCEEMPSKACWGPGGTVRGTQSAGHAGVGSRAWTQEFWGDSRQCPAVWSGSRQCRRGQGTTFRMHSDWATHGSPQESEE